MYLSFWRLLHITCIWSCNFIIILVQLYSISGLDWTGALVFPDPTARYAGCGRNYLARSKLQNTSELHSISGCVIWEQVSCNNSWQDAALSWQITGLLCQLNTTWDPPQLLCSTSHIWGEDLERYPTFSLVELLHCFALIGRELQSVETFSLL